MVAKLVYAAMMSVDGYVADKSGKFDWAEPDPGIHAFINDIQRQHSTFLYGRRMYEVMSAWENDDLIAGFPAYFQEFAKVWRLADKVVYSGTLPSVSTQRTRLERRFDPDAVRRMKATAGHDMLLGGPTLASTAFEADLIDECHVFVAPAVVGGGLGAFPSNLHLHLTLKAQHRFANGTAYCHYEVKR